MYRYLDLHSRKASPTPGGAINVQFVDTLKVSNVIFDLNTVGNSMGDRGNAYGAVAISNVSHSIFRDVSFNNNFLNSQFHDETIGGGAVQIWNNSPDKPHSNAIFENCSFYGNGLTSSFDNNYATGAL